MVRGFGELDQPILAVEAGFEQPEAEADAAAEARPYLLLDVRSEEDYAMGHIKTALSYPQVRLLVLIKIEIMLLKGLLSNNLSSRAA